MQIQNIQPYREHTYIVVHMIGEAPCLICQMTGNYHISVAYVIYAAERNLNNIVNAFACNLDSLYVKTGSQYMEFRDSQYRWCKVSDEYVIGNGSAAFHDDCSTEAAIRMCTGMCYRCNRKLPENRVNTCEMSDCTVRGFPHSTA